MGSRTLPKFNPSISSPACAFILISESVTLVLDAWGIADKSLSLISINVATGRTLIIKFFPENSTGKIKV